MAHNILAVFGEGKKIPNFLLGEEGNYLIDWKRLNQPCDLDKYWQVLVSVSNVKMCV